MARKPFHERMKDYELRRQMAVSLKERGYSLAEIGKRLRPQVSRQRVAQMIAKEVAKDGNATPVPK